MINKTHAFDCFRKGAMFKTLIDIQDTEALHHLSRVFGLIYIFMK